jgi:hypothetical protein
MKPWARDLMIAMVTGMVSLFILALGFCSAEYLVPETYFGLRKILIGGFYASLIIVLILSLLIRVVSYIGRN